MLITSRCRSHVVPHKFVDVIAVIATISMQEQQFSREHALGTSTNVAYERQGRDPERAPITETWALAPLSASLANILART